MSLWVKDLEKTKQEHCQAPHYHLAKDENIKIYGYK